MKRLFVYLFLIFSSAYCAQDKVYLMDGECMVVKVLEIAPDHITVVPLSESGAPFINSNESIPRRKVVLIEYKNGLIEVYNNPEKDLIRGAMGIKRKDELKNEQQFLSNFVSVNTLALCNADFSFFFERLIQSKKMGYGLMGAYNFNNHVTFPNSFLAVLHNAKKNYDFGAFVNMYPGHFKSKTTFYVGSMIKFTAFGFSKATEEVSGTSTTVKYAPARGSQLAFIFDIGTHTNLKNNFFIKTIAGIGLFPLFGVYKQQFNYLLNRDSGTQTTQINYSVLPKIYLGLNFGFSF